MCKNCPCSYCLTGTGGGDDVFSGSSSDEGRVHQENLVAQAIEKSSFHVNTTPDANLITCTSGKPKKVIDFID